MTVVIDGPASVLEFAPIDEDGLAVEEEVVIKEDITEPLVISTGLDMTVEKSEVPPAPESMIKEEETELTKV